MRGQNDSLVGVWMAYDACSLVEEQIARWRGEVLVPHVPGDWTPPDVVAMSCADGAAGRAIAQRVGELLGCPVYERQVVAAIARHRQLPIEAVLAAEAPVRGPWRDCVASLVRPDHLGRRDYLESLIRAVTALWGRGRCVIVGRGAGHVIARRHALSVRVTAPAPYRARAWARTRDLAEADAAVELHDRDSQQRDFLWRLFGAELEAPASYDLMVNPFTLDVQAVSQLIADAYYTKFA